ncbi:MAG TPA: hypothetical protein VF457_15940, partial [Burkholderiaceae bacterium]
LRRRAFRRQHARHRPVLECLSVSSQLVLSAPPGSWFYRGDKYSDAGGTYLAKTSIKPSLTTLEVKSNSFLARTFGGPTPAIIQNETGRIPISVPSLTLERAAEPAGSEALQRVGNAGEQEKLVLQGDPEFVGPTKPSNISKETYKALRGQTPTQEIRDTINIDGGPAFDPIYGHEVDLLEADHIVPMKVITQMPNFDRLAFPEQLDVLNNPDNFMGLGKLSNTSKGAKEWGEWPGHSQLGPVPDVFNDAMIDRAAELKALLQRQINNAIRNREP